MPQGVMEVDSERVLKSLGQSLKTYRQDLLRCTQAEMAERLGVSRSTYVRMESGDPRIPIGHWANAWRRLYRDKTQNLTVLDAVREAADPAEAIARYDAARAYAAHQDWQKRMDGDAVRDLEAATEAIIQRGKDHIPNEGGIVDDGGPSLDDLFTLHGGPNGPSGPKLS